MCYVAQEITINKDNTENRDEKEMSAPPMEPDKFQQVRDDQQLIEYSASQILASFHLGGFLLVSFTQSFFFGIFCS